MRPAAVYLVRVTLREDTEENNTDQSLGDREVIPTLVEINESVEKAVAELTGLMVNASAERVDI